MVINQSQESHFLHQERGNSNSALPMVSLLYCTWEKARQSLASLTFSSHSGTRHMETKMIPFTALKWRKAGHKVANSTCQTFQEVGTVFSHLSNLSKPMICFLMSTAHKKRKLTLLIQMLLR